MTSIDVQKEISLCIFNAPDMFAEGIVAILTQVTTPSGDLLFPEASGKINADIVPGAEYSHGGAVEVSEPKNPKNTWNVPFVKSSLRTGSGSAGRDCVVEVLRCQRTLHKSQRAAQPQRNLHLPHRWRQLPSHQRQVSLLDRVMYYHEFI